MTASVSPTRNAGARWSSNAAFVLTAAGTAIGLGNVWRFTFVAGENGGGLFVFIYVITVLAVGLPIMIAELLTGRSGRGAPIQAIATLTARHSASRGWLGVGLLSVFIPFVGIGYYSIVSGWILDYLARYAAFGGLTGSGADMEDRFDALLASPLRLQLWHTFFILMVSAIVARGVRAGVERAAKLFMPALFVMLLGLVAYAAFYGDFGRGAAFLFRPDFSKLSFEVVLLAVGQAFFSLAIGIGALMTFGSYLDEKTSLLKAAGTVAIADTAVAILAGLAIFPLVFANGLDADEGPGLIFVTLPTAFANMAGGHVIGAAFFLLLFFAAFTTGIGTMEPVVAWLVERGVRRGRAALYVGAGAWALGAVIAFSFNVWSGVRPAGFVPALEEKGIFDLVDFTIASVLLPINGLLIVLFVGRVLPRSVSRMELQTSETVYKIWRAAIRYVAPLAIASILMSLLFSW